MSDYLPLLVILLALTLLPFVVLMVTSFAKIIIVLGILRQALGLQQVPPNMVLNGIAMLLTIYVMAPVAIEANDSLKKDGRSFSSIKTFEDIEAVYQSVSTPWNAFLLKHSSKENRKFFVQSAKRLWPEQRAESLKETDWLVLAPAFVVTEIAEAFRIGFLVFLVFLLVDMVVAAILLAMGMAMVAPTIIALPFKILLFVVLDGWSRLLQGLILNYQ